MSIEIHNSPSANASASSGATGGGGGVSDLIDRCARAAYEACVTLRSDPTQPYQPWETLPDRWQRIYRVQAEAVRDVIGVELEERYAEIAARRLAQDAFDFGSAS